MKGVIRIEKEIDIIVFLPTIALTKEDEINTLIFAWLIWRVEIEIEKTEF